ncbi:PAS domain S-box protein [Gemmatimonadota bacterium]
MKSDSNEISQTEKSQLEQEKAFSDTLIDSLPGMFYMYDADSRLIRWNKNHETWTGYTAEEMKGMHVLDWFEGDEKQTVTQHLEEIFTKGSTRVEANLTNKDGSTTPYDFIGSLVDIDQHQYFIGMGVDVTERVAAREALQENEERYRSLFELAGDAIFLMRGDRIVECNPKTLEMFGCRREDILGKSPVDFSPEFQPDGIRTSEKAGDIIGRTLMGETILFEHQHCRLDRTPFDTEITISRIELEKEDILLAFVRDVTKRKEFETQLKSSEEKYRSIFNSFQDVYYHTDKDGRVVIASPSVRDQLGYDPEEIVGRPATDFYAEPADRDRMLVELEKAGRVRDFDVKFVKKDGEITDVALSAQAILGDDGEIAGVEGVLRDVSDRKRAEENIKRLSDVVEQAEAPIFLTDPEGVIEYINPAFSAITGFTGDDAIGKTPRILNSGLMPQQYYKNVWSTIESGAPISAVVTNKRKNGDIWYYDQTIVPLKDENGLITHFVSTGKDITADREAQESLRQSEEKYREVIENAGEGIFVAQDGVIKYLNPFALDFIGYPEEELHSRPFLEFIHPDDQEIVLNRYVERLAGGDVPDITTYRIIVSGGVEKWVEASTVLITWEGEPATLNFVSDITDQKFAREELQRSEASLSRAQTIAHLGNWEWDISTGGLWWSDEVYRIFGLEPQEFEATYDAFLERIHPDDREFVSTAVERAVSEHGEYDIEHRVTRPDGTERIVNEIGEVEYDEAGEPLNMIGTVLDITERKLTEQELRDKEEQLLQAQKLEAIGHLAGGVAHDFNNMLGVIVGYSDIALMELEDADPLKKNFLRIRDAADRATGLTRQLLAFSRKQTIQARNIDLNDTISNLEKMLGRLIGEHIDIKIELESGPCLIHSDPVQIDQVLMNLAVNARDAMPDGGELTIETSSVTVDQDSAANLDGLAAGQYQLLTVSDTGHGMDELTRSQIFDPFFTTKEVGKGTGLGLATVYGIVRQSNGAIDVHSEPGQGTSFMIYIPVTEESATTEAVPDEKIELESSGERILLVEDQDDFRDLTHRILKMYGYKVLVARSAGEAFLMCEQQEEPIQLMLTDVVMPQMSGPKLAERVADIQPGMKVLYMSGYTYDIMDQHGLKPEDIDLIEKPFSPVELAQKIREVLIGQ